jgi:oligosaccharide reducing-end xylanase
MNSPSTAPRHRQVQCLSTWLSLRTPVLIALVALLACTASRLSVAASHHQPDDGSGAYDTGKYRNLFAEQGHSGSEISAKIEAAYQQLFHGDPQTQAVYFPAGKNADGPLAYLTDWANHDARTEGMSYGMMISVQLNHKPEFDALWNWAKTYMYISDPHHPSYGYFSWSCKTDGTPNEETPAPDGEEYFVMALYFADARWGSGSGIYNYKAQADTLLTTMRHRAIISGPTRFGPRTVGNEVDEKYKMIRFVPGVDRGDFTDPSYHLPAFYELWARWGPQADRQFWKEAADVSRAFFVKTTNPDTGLAPNYANFDGTPKTTRFAQSSIFSYDAWRTASNWSVDWSWWGKAPQERMLSDRIQAFFATQGLDKYGDQYSLDGKEIANRHSTGLVATNAVASLAATDPRAKKFVDILWRTPVPSGEQRYYDGMLYIMSMMHLSGEFRIWSPQTRK